MGSGTFNRGQITVIKYPIRKQTKEKNCVEWVFLRISLHDTSFKKIH